MKKSEGHYRTLNAPRKAASLLPETLGLIRGKVFEEAL